MQWTIEFLQFDLCQGRPHSWVKRTGCRILRSVLHKLVERVAQVEIFVPVARQAACEAVLDLVTAVAAAPRLVFGPTFRVTHGPGPSALWLTGETVAPVAARIRPPFVTRRSPCRAVPA